jgi:hypothetical protein
MAQETDAQLQTRRGVIENETTEGANTTERVGDMFENIIDSKINNDKIIDEDTMSSDSATHVPTQQSVKAYVDSLGITREFDRAWSAELLFDKNEIHYAETTLAGDVEFTINPDGNLEDQFCSIVQEIITDGTHAVSFVGFKYVLGDVQNGSLPEAGTYIVFFLYFNGVATVNWGIPNSETANLTPLAAPANFAAVAAGDDQIDLSWDAVPNVSSYELYHSTTGGSGPWTLIATPAAGETTYSDTGLAAATTYHYRIRAIGNMITFSNSQYSVDAESTEDSGDVTAPTFTFEPADAATNIAVNHPITITASEPLIDDDGVTEITDANVANYIVLKEDNGAGANIAFTATIDVTKTIITVTPNVVYPSLDNVFVQIDGVEDVNGNEATADDATFATSDFTEMEGNYMSLGTQIDSVIVGADKNFELEWEVEDLLQIGSINNMFQKYTTSGSANKSFITYVNGDDVTVAFYANSSTIRRQITWTNALSGFTSGVITVKYFGAIDTNDGLDRVELWLDGVEITAGKAITSGAGTTWPFDIVGNAQPFLLQGPAFRKAKNFVVRNNMGATTIVDITLIRTGTDVSGNSFDGTWN